MVVVRTWAGVTAAPAGGLPSQPGPHATSALPAACADFFASSLTFAITLLLEYSDCMLADLAAGAARAAWDPACTTQALPAPPGNVLAAVDARLTPNPQLAEELREVGRLWWGCWVVFRAALLCYGDTPLQALAGAAVAAAAGGSRGLQALQFLCTAPPPARNHTSPASTQASPTCAVQVFAGGRDGLLLRLFPRLQQANCICTGSLSK